MERFGAGPVLPFAFAASAALAVVGCGEFPPAPELEAEPTTADARGIVPGQANVVEVTASHSGDLHQFTLSADAIPHGWTTFRFVNASHSDHFVLLFKAPAEAIAAADGVGQSLLDHWHETVTVPFQEAFDPYSAGAIDYDAFVGELVGAISQSAPWFLAPGAPAMGGPGLTAAGETSETTVRLEPGTYILECYVKDADEEFHSYNGMLAMLTVTGEASDAPEPRSTLGVSLSSTGGIQIPSAVRPGKHTFAIEFIDQTTYEHLQGHNAHLVRLAGTEAGLLEDLAAWMDWRQNGALAFRAPEGARFLGGTMEMGEGGTAYYTVNLTPGEYAWIAEVPDPAGKNMLKTFTVPSGR